MLLLYEKESDRRRITCNLRERNNASKVNSTAGDWPEDKNGFVKEDGVRQGGRERKDDSIS